MSTVPRVSIGMPVYNGEGFLAESLDSLLSQTFGEFELIISDNASTDATETICRRYMARDPRVRYFRNESNMGAAWNYNRVFQLSTGKYFKWAAADDLCDPVYLAKCVDILDQLPEVVVCYPKTTIINDQGNVERLYDDGLNLRHESAVQRFRLAIHQISECNAVFGLIRTEELGKTCLIGNYPGSDRVLLTELSLHGQFFEIPELLFFRREHARASSCNRSIESTQEFFDPQTVGEICMFTWKHQFRYLSFIAKASVTPSEKVLLLFSVFVRTIALRRRLGKEVFNAARRKLANGIRWYSKLKKSRDMVA